MADQQGLAQHQQFGENKVHCAAAANEDNAAERMSMRLTRVRAGQRRRVRSLNCPLTLRPTRPTTTTPAMLHVV